MAWNTHIPVPRPPAPTALSPPVVVPGPVSTAGCSAAGCFASDGTWMQRADWSGPTIIEKSARSGTVMLQLYLSRLPLTTPVVDRHKYLCQRPNYASPPSAPTISYIAPVMSGALEQGD